MELVDARNSSYLDVVENPLAAAAYGPGLRLVISKFDSHCKSEWL